MAASLRPHAPFLLSRLMMLKVRLESTTANNQLTHQKHITAKP